LIQRISNKVKRVLKSLKIDLDIFIYNSFNRNKQRRKLSQKIKNSITEDSHQTYNSNQKRSVELNQEDKNLTQVIVTCYFTLKPDPQTGSIRNAADFKYIQPWYDSLIKIDAHGIILHDGLEAEFIALYQTPTIQFRLCEMGNYSIFEERWLLYHLFLRQLPQLEKVFFTDSNDVYITKDPFPFITNETALYVGRDNANRIKDSGWMKEERTKFLKESHYKLAKTYEYQWVYNAGVTGGNYPVMLFLTNEMSKLIFKASSNHHKDMTLINIVIHEHFYPRLSNKDWDQKLVVSAMDSVSSHENLITGFPFNSGFKDFDFNSSACFIHK
jgi:hypothetical protein